MKNPEKNPIPQHIKHLTTFQRLLLKSEARTQLIGYSMRELIAEHFRQGFTQNLLMGFQDNFGDSRTIIKLLLRKLRNKVLSVGFCVFGQRARLECNQYDHEIFGFGIIGGKVQNLLILIPNINEVKGKFKSTITKIQQFIQHNAEIIAGFDQSTQKKNEGVGQQYPTKIIEIESYQSLKSLNNRLQDLQLKILESLIKISLRFSSCLNRTLLRIKKITFVLSIKLLKDVFQIKKLRINHSDYSDYYYFQQYFINYRTFNYN